MDRVKKEVRTHIAQCHSFFCDECGKFLGESVEFADGYYEKFGQVPRPKMPLEDRILGMRFKPAQTCLCDDCLAKKQDDVRKALIACGFVFDGNISTL